MNRFSLFMLLRRNSRLSYRRSPAFEQSMIAQVMLYIGAGFMVIYLIFIGTLMAMAANEGSAPGLLIATLPVFLIIDFGVRFMVQQTPAMLVKPYLLLPLPRHSVVEHFLVSSLLSGYNLMWLGLFLPYAVVTLFGGENIFTVFGILISGMLFVLANSQWYLLIRTLIGRSMFWWALPAVVYATYIVPMLLSEDYKIFDSLFDFYVSAGSAWWMPLVAMLLLGFMFAVNRHLQFRFAYEEVASMQKKESDLKRVSSFSFLERFGQIGEYLKLEIKSIMRNKAIRSRVVMSLVLIVMFSGLIAYTDIYDGFMMRNFWCYYCFSIYGMTTLVKIMAPEGNYIDLLMVHRENIIALLRAKYYFHVAILVVPMVIMMPAVFEGKFSWLMLLAYMTITSGLLYGLLFQMAVYNKQTIPLNQKITGKGNVENGLQLIIELVAMTIPMVLVAVLLLLFSETTAYLVMIAIGVVCTLAHPWWLKNIYLRMMARKYENLEGFHATR